MKFSKIAVSLLLGVFFLTGCAKNTDAVIKVNDRVITRGEFNQEFKLVKKAQMANVPKEEQKKSALIDLIIKEKLAKDMIIKVLLEEEFVKRKIEVTDKEVEDKINEITKNFASKEELFARLSKDGISKERFMSDMKKDAQTEKLITQLNIPKITEKEAQKRYAEEVKNYEGDELPHVYHIFFNANKEELKKSIAAKEENAKISSSEIEQMAEEEMQKKYKKAQEVLAELKKNPKNFAALAKKYSEDKETASKGGEVGYLNLADFANAFGQMHWERKTGAIEPIVESHLGYHILLIKDRKKEQPPKFQDVKNDYMLYLNTNARNLKIEEFIKSLLDSAKIEYLDENFKPEIMEKNRNEAIQKEAEAENKSARGKTKFDEAIENTK